MIRSRLNSFIAAFKGIGNLLSTQVNARIHLVAAIIVIIAGFVFRISEMEWLVAILCIGSVIAMEAVNSAIELLCNKVEPNHDKTIGRIKDIAASAVLITAIAAAVAGLIIFLPKFFKILCFIYH